MMRAMSAVVSRRFGHCATRVMCVALAASPWSLRAQPSAVQLTELDCQRGSRLVVRDASRSEVLQQLAQAWQFRLDVDTALTAPLRLDAVGPPDELLARVLQPYSFLLLRQPDPRCPGRTTVARVFVIGNSGAAAAPPRQPGPARAMPPAPAPAAYVEQADALTQHYLHSHGAPAARP
jgi:hypothetical protein